MSRLVGGLVVPAAPTITLVSRNAVGSGIVRTGIVSPASGASPWSDAANALLAFPFTLVGATTFYKGFWVNGSAAGGNSEVAIYDENFNKIVTTGSVAGATNSVPQVAALTATVRLAPGLFYAAMAHDATTTNQLSRFAITSIGNVIWQSLGCWRQAGITLGSLPATATPGDMTTVGFPLFGLITRSVFDV